MNGAWRCLVALLVAGLAAAPAGAGWTIFLPRPVDNGAELDLYFSEESEELDRGRASAAWSDDFGRQKLTLFSNGYVYHPRFLVYLLSVGGGFRQEEYASTSFGSSIEGDIDDTSLEYDAQLYLLPEHPYSFHLWASRFEPLLRERSTVLHDRVDSHRGLEATYRRKPYLARARVYDRTVERDLSRTDQQGLALSAEYFRELSGGRSISLAGAFDPSRFEVSTGLEGETSEAWVDSWVSLERFSLRSLLRRDDHRQEGRVAGSFDNEELNWEERLVVPLPWSLELEANYRYRDDETVTRAATPGAPEIDLSSTRNEAEVSLLHRLYDSLESRYRYQVNDTASSFGEVDNVLHAFDVDYRKAIPRGRLFLGMDLSRVDSGSDGGVAVGNEAHPDVAVPGRFTLDARNVDVRGISVFLESPRPPFEIIRLVEGIHYEVSQVGDTVEIFVVTLPPEFALNEVFDFRVSYLTTGRYELRSDMRRYDLSFDLLDGLITPYASWSEVDSEVLAGSFPGDALDSTTQTVGTSIQYGGFRLRTELQEVDWDVAPYESWLGELHYGGNLGRTTTLSASVSRHKRSYPEGRSRLDTERYREVFDTAAASLQQRLFDDTLVFSVGYSYSQMHSLIDSESYSFTSSLSWRIGLLDVTAGASRSTSETVARTTLRTGRDHDLYYVRLRRTLF